MFVRSVEIRGGRFRLSDEGSLSLYQGRGTTTTTREVWFGFGSLGADGARRKEADNEILCQIVRDGVGALL